MRTSTTIAVLCLSIVCGDGPAELATAAASTVELGPLATPHITLDTEGATFGLRFTTYETLDAPQWLLERRGASWQEVATDGPTYPLTAVPTGTQFRLRVCAGGRCSGTSPPVTVTIPPGGGPPTLTSSWNNPAVGQACEPEPGLPASDWVGTLEGTAGVSSGDATYSIPIPIPPGRGGMQPTIALVYDSGAGSGIAGQGWTLSATSAIHRCERTQALDRDTRPVSIAGVDRLCLDGSPLVLATGTYGSSGATYRAELAKFDRITQAGELSVTMSCFTVETKSGLRRKYGRCDGIDGIHVVAVPGGGTYPMSWALAREEDRRGNTVDYEYAAQFGQHVLVAIRYTGRAGAPPPTNERRVAFAYADRPDQVIGYRYRGVQERSSRRLTAITTYVNQRAVRRYELAYKASAATGRSLLASVRMCPGAGPCDPATSLPPTTFAYSEDTPMYTRERVTLPDQALSQAHVYGDYDGDGVRDKLITTREAPWGGAITGAKLELSNFGAPNSIDFVVGGVSQQVIPGFNPRLVGTTLPREVDLDFDHDGRTDLLGEDSSNMFAIASWNASTQAFEIRQSNVAAFDESGAVPGQLLFEPHDFNGDGKTDLYAHQTRTIHLQCPGPNPAGFIGFCSEIMAPQLVALPACAQVVDIRDWNGDGLPDFLIETINAPGCTAGPSRMVMTRGMFVPADMASTYQVVDLSPTFRTTLAGTNSRNLFADINGDGLVDIVRTTQPVPALYINQGGTFVNYPVSGRINFGWTPWTQQTWNDPSTLQDPEDIWGRLGERAKVADIDGDGIDELMVPVEVTVSACTLVNRASGAETCLLSAIAAASAETTSSTWSLASGQSPNNGDHCYQEAYYEGNVIEQCSVVPGETNIAEDGDFYQAGAQRHHTVYRWDAIKFTINTAGTASIRQQRTNFEGPLGRTTFRDWNSDGVVDGIVHMMGVYGYNCGHAGCPLVEISRYNDPESWTGPGSPSRTINGLRVSAGHGQFVVRQTARQPDRLLSVTNGVGHRSSWVYATLASAGISDCAARPFGLPATAAYTPIAFYVAHYRSEPPDGIHSLFSSSKLVVAQFEQDNGGAAGGPPNLSCYHYEDAWWNNQGRGFLAFGKITEERRTWNNAANDVRITTSYETRFPKVGRVRTTKISRITDPVGDDVYFSHQSSTWDQDCSFAGGRPAGEPFAEACFVYSTLETDDHRDLATRAPIGSRTVQRTYAVADRAYGNVSTITTTRQDSQTQTTTTTYTYDYSGAAAWWIDRVDKVVTTAQPIVDPSLPVTASAKTRSTRYEYYPDGHPAARLVRAEYLQEGIAHEALTSEYAYDPYGNRSSVTQTASLGGSPRTTMFGYAASNGYFLDTQTNALGHTTRFGFDLTTGAPLSVTDPNLTTMAWQYDAIGRLTLTSVPGLRNAHHRTYRCDASCPQNAVSRTRVVQQGAPTLDVYRDVFGRAVLERQTAFDGTRVAEVMRHYDSRGHLIYESTPSYDPATARATWWEEFDALGRPGLKGNNLDAPGVVREERYTYSGLTTMTTIAGTYPGPSHAVTTDLDGRVLQTTDGAGNRVRLRYDPQGLLALTEDPNGTTSRTDYDARGRRIQLRDPDRGTHNFEWDGFNQLITRTDARNAIVRTTFDVLGRPLQRTIDGFQLPLATWTYDTRRIGALDSETAANGFVRELSYDLFGRIAQVATTIDGKTFVTDYGYDCRGKLVSLRYPSGKEVGFAFNEHGYLAHEDDWGMGSSAPVTLRTIEALDPSGAVEVATFMNDAKDVQSYYANGQLSTHSVATAGLTIHDVVYRYEDAFGNLTSQENATLGVTEQFHYDAANRLDLATRTFPSGPPRTTTYSYDNAGNFTSKSDRATEFAYGTPWKLGPSFAGPNGIKSYTTPGGTTVSDFRYDANGSLLQGDGRTMVYDWVFELPTSITSSGSTVTFAYDPSGLRFKKVEAGTTTYYIDRIYEHVETASLDQTLRHYIGGSIVQSIARPFGNPTGNQTTSFVHVDRLGSTELVTPGTAAELATVIAMNTLERHAFDPYGAPRNGDWTDGTGVWGSPATPRGFTSHEHLDANQLVHMNGRVYDPGLGRFLSVDLLVGVPLSTQSYNRYGYLLGNPTSGIDPSGFFPQIYTSDKDIEEIVITCDRECQRRAIAKQDHTLHPWDRNFLTPQLGGRRLSAARGDQRTISVDTGSPLRRRVVDERLDPVQAEFDRNTEALIRMEAARIGVVPEALAPGITTEGLGDDLLELGAELAEGLAYAGDPHELKWEHRDEYGHLVGEGLQLSGGTHPGRRLNRREQTDRHSEPLLFAPRPWLPEEGHRWSLVGQKDPCSNCKAVLKARSLFGAEISYYSLESRRTFYYREGEQFFYPRPSRRINLIGTSLGGLRARTTRR